MVNCENFGNCLVKLTFIGRMMVKMNLNNKTFKLTFNNNLYIVRRMAIVERRVGNAGVKSFVDRSDRPDDERPIQVDADAGRRRRPGPIRRQVIEYAAVLDPDDELRRRIGGDRAVDAAGHAAGEVDARRRVDAGGRRPEERRGGDGGDEKERPTRLKNRQTPTAADDEGGDGRRRRLMMTTTEAMMMMMTTTKLIREICGCR